MASRSTLVCIVLLFLCLSEASAFLGQKRKQHPRQPCKRLVLYFHDIIYNGKNAENATSAIIGAPSWADKIILAGQKHFGDLVVFDDPITLDNNLHASPVGRAQGFYLYDKKEIFTAWIAFSFVLDSKDYKGTINFAGADPLMNKTRDISVIGGTGDFFMSRGIATLMTDAFEGEVYFRLQVDIKLYECWHSRQYFQDSNVDEEWNGLSPQASTTNAHDVPELSLFDGERYQTTLGATYGLNSSSDVEKSHEQLTPSTAFCLQDAVTSLMSSHTLLKFPMLIGLFTLLDSHQAMAGLEFTSGLPSLPYFGDLGDISTGFASVRKTSLVWRDGESHVLQEQRSHHIPALLAARNSGTVIFIGTFSALAAMTIISVVLGRTFHYVDDILPFRFGESDLPVDDIAAVCLLIYFGVSTLIEAASGDGLKAEEEQKEHFSCGFVAEWGDKSFFSTIALAAASSPLGVIGGALAGHAAATLIAVLGGSLLGTFLSEKVVAYVGGTLFLVFAAVTLIEIVT
ncbi:hypothetical protein IFM89_039883 [Coptis chinensis]|uniref:Dirigent protein n=1 Tax=Coptis chinensis TaxID=261450 RepID=A0A835GSM6_9MAGN|nr:hypothetical protein IFM89_039883 [Coptis chinensis]